jgi:hypothetical protein
MNNQVIGNIILESSQEVPEVTIVSEKNNKVTGTGIIQTIGDENRNGRIYELKDMKPEVEGDRIQKELIPTGNMRGHDGHPSSTELSVQSVINPILCSVKYKKIWIEGNEIHANFCGTNNEHGKAFNEDLLDGDRPSFALRALGSVDRERNGKCYVRNIRIITWDRVIFPSHKRAYMQGLVTSKNESAVLESAGYNKNGFYYKQIGEWSDLECEQKISINKRIEAPTGAHDDVCCADALANFAACVGQRRVAPRPSMGHFGSSFR